MSVPDGARECQSEPGVVQAGYKRTKWLVYQDGLTDFIVQWEQDPSCFTGPVKQFDFLGDDENWKLCFPPQVK